MARKPLPASAALTPLGPAPRGQEPLPAGTDPYVLWAEARNFKGFASPSAVAKTTRPWRHLSCVAELDTEALSKVRGGDWRSVLWKDCKVHVPAAYQELANLAGTSTYATLVVRTSRYYQLQAHPFVKRLVLSLPRAGRSQRFESLASIGDSKPFSGPLAGKGGKPVLAIIDTGLPLLSNGFAGRLRYAWDQDVGTREPGKRGPSPLAWPWAEPADFGYGRELSGAALDELLQHCSKAGWATDENSLYARLLYPAKPGPGREARADQPLAAWAVPASTHGAQCAGVAAAKRTGALQDAASSADLVFVQLPSETVSDTSGGGLSTYALDALRYVVARTDPRAPLVVNFSYGAAAGPHNATAVLDCAIAALVDSRPGMVLVVPAGNLGTAPNESIADERRLHAQLDVQPGESRTLDWCVPANSDGDHSLEIWPVGGAEGPLQVCLRAPDGTLAQAAPGEASFAPAASGGAAPAFGVVNSVASPLGLRATPPWALAPTTLAVVSADAPSGTWKLSLSNHGHQPLRVDAWIERSDPLFGRETLQSHFARHETAASAQATLSSLSHADAVLVVGGLVGTGQQAPVASYSSAGPARPPATRLGPDFSACCEENAGTPYQMVPGFPSGSWVAGNGTSIAAPVVARWALNALAGNPQEVRALAGRDLIDWLRAQATPRQQAAPPDARRGLQV